MKPATLCDFIDPVYEHNGQVVTTWNRSMAKLAEKWGADEAETIVRRIGGDGGFLVWFPDRR